MVGSNKSERRVQQEIVLFYRNSYCLFFHSPRCLIISIPNEGNPRLTLTGMYAGASDLIIFHYLPTRSLRILFVEVKSEQGELSPKQIKFQAMIKKMNGIMSYHVVRSLEEFKLLILGA